MPSTLTGYKDNEDNDIPAIGDNAFAFCTGATITIPTCATTFGTTTPFNQVGYYDEDAKEIKGGVVATLSDAGDNNALINALYLARYVNVTLDGRTLYKDGDWNTLCLPFDMTNAQLTAQLAPYELKELDLDGYYNINNSTTRYTYVYSEQEKEYVYIDEAANKYTGVVADLHQTGFDATSGALNLFFKDATSIKAGKPYLIKWNKADGYDQAAPATRDLVNPEFSNLQGVTFQTTSTAVTSSDGYVSFLGIYSPTDIYTAEKTNLYLGTGNALYYPWADGMNSYNLNAFRAYFQLNNGLTVGDVQNTRLNFGEENEVNGVNEVLVQDKRQGRAIASLEVNDDSWFTLDGRMLVGKPTDRHPDRRTHLCVFRFFRGCTDVSSGWSTRSRRPLASRTTSSC